MIQRCLRTALTAAVATLLLPTSLEAKKFPNIGVNCPDEYPEFRVDAEGKRDTCVALAELRCPSGQNLKVDAVDEVDVCAIDASPAETDGAAEESTEAEPEGEAAAAVSHSKPECPERYGLVVHEGRDTCERKGKPKCRSGYDMKISVGPDMCIR